MMAKDRILGFDMARIVAIFVVIGIYHNFGYAGIHYYYDAGTLSLVYSTLGVFTFLSAFLLSSKYSFRNGRDIIRFYIKRVFRIWPLFAISSFVLVIIRFNELLPTLKGLIGLSPFWKPAPTTMWYVAMLISLYIITPVVLCEGVKKQCIRVFCVMALLGFIQIGFNSVVPKTFNYYTVYLVGLLLGRNYFEQTMHFLSAKKTFFISIAWGFLFVIVCITGNKWLKSFTGVLGIVAILNMCLLISRMIRTRPRLISIISILSYASFCAYLFHREIIWILLHFKVNESGWLVFLEVLLMGVPLTFIISYVIQLLYDRFTKSINYLNRL